LDGGGMRGGEMLRGNCDLRCSSSNVLNSNCCYSKGVHLAFALIVLIAFASDVA